MFATYINYINHEIPGHFPKNDQGRLRDSTPRLHSSEQLLGHLSRQGSNRLGAGWNPTGNPIFFHEGFVDLRISRSLKSSYVSLKMKDLGLTPPPKLQTWSQAHSQYVHPWLADPLWPFQSFQPDKLEPKQLKSLKSRRTAPRPS